MILLVRLPRPSHLRVALIGPSPSCLTARTLVRHGSAGLNRLKLGPRAVRGIKPGAYLVRIRADGRLLPQRTAVMITPGRQVVPNRSPSALHPVCIRAATPFALGTPGLGTPAAAPAAAAAAGHASVRRSHGAGVLPSFRDALRNATTGAGHLAAAAAGGSRLLFLVLCGLVAAAVLFALFPLARHLQQRHARRAG